MTKKILAMLLALLMAVSAAACTGNSDPADTSGPVSSTPAPESTDPTPSTDIPDTTEGADIPDVTNPTGGTDVPDVTDPTGGTDVPGVTDPTGGTDVPGVTDPTGGTDVPGITDPTGGTDVPGVTDPTEPKPTEPKPTEPPKPKPTKITASVSGSYKVGDTLKTSAFTVKVTMSDGTVKTNPSGWSASPLKLSSTSNKITVTYQGLTTTVTVKATLGAINGMDVVEEAIKYIRLPYVDGGNSLKDGTDCSGFTKLIYAKFGIDLPRTPSAQNKVGTIISAEKARPGDLLVETYPEEDYYDGHSGIYIGGGNMISAMPGDGVVVGKVHDGMDYIRIFDNSYAGTDTDAYFDTMDAMITQGHLGELTGLVYVNWDEGTTMLKGTAPNGSLSTQTGYVRLDVNAPKKGYENLLEGWKSLYLARKYYIEISFSGSDGNSVAYSYWKGEWVLSTELREKCDAGEISWAVYSAAGEFYGPFWNSNAVITNGLGEVVDLSTCPGIPNYSSIAKPGDPNEGKASRLSPDPEAKRDCKYAHRWESKNYDPEKKDYIRTCRDCGFQITASYGVKNHTHQLMMTYWNGGYFEPSEVEYSCMTCDYSKSYVIDPCTGADHTHDYSYAVCVFEPTCIMDGFTLHECICGLSYKDNIKNAPGHSYSGKECTDCSHEKRSTE